MGVLCRGCQLRLGRGERGGFSMGVMGLGRFMLELATGMELGGLGVRVARVVGVEGFRRDLFRSESGDGFGNGTGTGTGEVMIDEL